jgi:hypothetical protein
MKKDKRSISWSADQIEDKSLKIGKDYVYLWLQREAGK